MNSKTDMMANDDSKKREVQNKTILNKEKIASTSKSRPQRSNNKFSALVEFENSGNSSPNYSGDDKKSNTPAKPLDKKGDVRFRHFNTRTASSYSQTEPSETIGKITSTYAKKNNLKINQQTHENRRKPANVHHGGTSGFKNPGLSKTDIQDLENLQSKMSTLNLNRDVQNLGDVNAYKNLKWTSIGIKHNISTILEGMGFTFPSPVQTLSIPHALEGKDLLVRAKNGTGKSISFIVPAISKIDINKGIQAIILVPVRELALQIAKIMKAFERTLQIKSIPLVGGAEMVDDIIRITGGVHVIIGTPGRVMDVLSRKITVISDNVQIVFDEADKLLDSHFYGAIFDLLKLVPRKRQLLLYSATFPQSIEGFVSQNMNNPLKIKVSEQNIQNVKQYYTQIKRSSKLPCLKSLLSILKFNQCVIYCNSIANVENLAKKITQLGLSAYFIHSNMAQEERNIVYLNFSGGKCRILVSTDITTRGMNAPGVDVVINFDLPFSSESYLHRVGRAGRFGRKGCAINFLQDEEMPTIHQYETALTVPIHPISDYSFKEFCN